MNITLAKALTLKNRITKKINDIRNEIQTYNQITNPADNKRPIDINENMQKLAKLQEFLVSLKTAINQANAAIIPLIYLNAEMKGEINFLNGIPKREGKDSHDGYGGGAVTTEYHSVLTHNLLAGLVQNLEESIDKNQETIDTHNYTTKIFVADELFVLLKS